MPAARTATLTMTGKRSRHPPRPSSRQHDHSRARTRLECPIRHGHGERLLVDILSVGEHGGTFSYGPGA
jgi:hypothetical protein